MPVVGGQSSTIETDDGCEMRVATPALSTSVPSATAAHVGDLAADNGLPAATDIRLSGNGAAVDDSIAP